MKTTASLSRSTPLPTRRCAALSALLAGLFASAAWADEPVAPAVVVKGTNSQTSAGYGDGAVNVGGKGDASAKETPQPVSVVTRQRMDDQNMVRLDDLARRTTGVVVLANDQGRSSIFIRGYELDSALIDGLPAPLSSIYGTQPDLSIFERVEVLRGPAGLYSGFGEPGGTVNLIRKRAQKKFAGSGSVALGSWDARRGEADVTGSLNEDGSVRGRLVGAYQKKNSSVDVNKNENGVGYGTLDFDLSSRTTLSIAGISSKSDVTPFNGLPSKSNGDLLDLERSTFIGANWNRFENQANEGMAELVHHLESGGHIKAAMRYVDRDVNFKYAYAGSAVSNTGTVTRTAIARDYREKGLATDLHLNKPFKLWGLQQNLITGIDYRQYDQTTLSGSATVSGTTNVYSPTYDWPEPTIAYSSRTNVKPEQYGLYSNLRIKPWQPLTLIAGARLSRYKSVTTNLATGVSTELSLPTQLTPYGGIVYELGENWAAYTSYTSIFQPQTNLDASGKVLDPRKGNNIELGVKGEHMGGLLNSQFSLFRLRDTNRAIAVPSTAYYEASGKTEVQGFEAELSGRLLPGWEASIGYAYTETEILSGASGTSGTTFSTYTPHHSVTLWTRYDFQSGALQNAYVGGGLRAMSSFYTAGTGYRIDQDAYAVVDTLFGYKFSPKLDVSLTINNLFDKKYYQRVGGTSVFNFYGEPRSLWLKTGLKF
ncbi:TonB-dependent siderophore receptor [Uliginosibacterium sediminicola]|uniref:TonB-dependent siderophore receptor n=1 Tax=Uliginosibacterium sediminicola TaxID=2024550 RepID=A0ABU9Z380_9RHOO